MLITAKLIRVILKLNDQYVIKVNDALKESIDTYVDPDIEEHEIDKLPDDMYDYLDLGDLEKLSEYITIHNG